MSRTTRPPARSGRARRWCGAAVLSLLALLAGGTPPARAADPATPANAAATSGDEEGANEATQTVFEDLADSGPGTDAEATDTDPDAGGEPAAPSDSDTKAATDAARPLFGWSGYLLDVSWDEGVRVREKNNRFQLKLGGRLLLDAAHISGDTTIDSTFKTGWLGGARAARIDITGTAGTRVYYRLQVDVTGESDSDFSPSDYLKQLFVGVTGLGPLGRLEVGILKEPISMGVLTSGLNIDFLERGLPTVMAPGFNVGAVLRNEVFDDRASWAFGIFRGQGADGDRNAVDLAGRISGMPWRDEEAGRFLHIGASYKFETGDFVQRYRARPETHWGSYWIDTGDIASDQNNLLGLELAGIWDPVSFQAEWISSWVRVPGGSAHFWGVYGQVSYFVTGEQRYYLTSRRVFGRVQMNDQFSIRRRTWGALELTARYAYLNLDDAAIRGGRLRDITVGVNWYLLSNLRLMFNYTRARLNGANDGNVVGMRFQIDR